jgi:chromosome segregation ATPase
VNTTEFLILGWLFLPIPLLLIIIFSHRKIRTQSKDIVSKEARLKKYAPIISIDHELERLSLVAAEVKEDINKAKEEYAEKYGFLQKIKSQIAVYDERLAFTELGIYEPHFNFDDSEIYKTQIIKVRQRQKDMVSNKEATFCPDNWSLDGSLSKGKAMMNRQMRLTMRAFNNECEAAIANTRWNNVVAMEKRILNSAKQINSANTSMKMEINEKYVALKLDELHLTHEYREQLKIEKEEKSELKRLEREEKKLLAEARRAEREEERFQQLLERARKEANVDESRIAELEAALAEAHEKTERAQAMAEMTKSGYVYVISNIGSFGADVVKIGLTRRLDPNDRVKELGDASVPFSFDTHAMIYSDEAPALEAALHNEFASQRINQSNMRKEFFKVDLDAVEEAVGRIAPSARFFKDREAQEWHETLARRQEVLTGGTLGENDNLPASI